MTERQWQAAMRKAGWRSMGYGVWRHKQTNAKFEGWKVDTTKGDTREQWRIWAEAGETPPPF